ncbi:TMF-regulated nuclear protein 1 [Gastrophryne carolinensis]
MPIAQGNSLWSFQRVFNHGRSGKQSETKDTKPVPSPHSSSFWKAANPSSFFLRRFSSTPCRSPKRSASAPQGLRQNPPSDLGPSDPPDCSAGEGCSRQSSISKSQSAPHTFAIKPYFLNLSADYKPKFIEDPASDSTVSSPENVSPPCHPLNSSLANKSPIKATFPNHQEPPSALSDDVRPEPLPSKLSSPQPALKNKSVTRVSSQNSGSLQGSPSPQKTARPQSTHCRHTSSSSLHNSPISSPLKSPPPCSSRRVSTQGEQLPVAPSPPWSELIEARRRLMAVECRRRALCALETRVQQVQYVFLQAEMRVARQKEGLAKLVEAAGRAEVQTAVHGQRIRKALRHHKPRLLACAMCVPWPARAERRGSPHPRHSRCASFQGRMLRGCVGSEDISPRD